MFKTFTLLPIAAFAAQWEAGECPAFKSDMEEFNPRHMTGLWFEYVWTKGFQEGNEYLCSSWTILDDGGLDKPMIVYNQQMPGIEVAEGEDKSKDAQPTGEFFQIDLTWAPSCECGHRDPKAKYTRDQPEGADPVGERTLTFLRTNYFSYALAASCAERDGPNGKEHTTDYVVLTRDKQVPITIRKLARQAALDHGLSSEFIEGMVKSKTKTCWGKDFYE